MGSESRDAQEETEPQVGRVGKRLECPSPDNRKRPRTCLAESGQSKADELNQRDNATDIYTSVEKDTVRDEEDPKPPRMVTSSRVRISSDPDQEVVQEEASPDVDLPPGWTSTKLEPDW